MERMGQPKEHLDQEEEDSDDQEPDDMGEDNVIQSPQQREDSRPQSISAPPSENLSLTDNKIFFNNRANEEDQHTD